MGERKAVGIGVSMGIGVGMGMGIIAPSLPFTLS